MNPEDTSLVTRPSGANPDGYVELKRTAKRASRERIRGKSWHAWALAAVAAAALVLGVESLLQVDARSIGDLGLIGALPPSYFVALGLSLAGFVMTLGLPKARPALLTFQILVLVVVLQGADPIVFGLPRLEASYRHMGIAGYIAQTGQFNPRLDAYFNWPGFFAMLAMLSKATGVSDLSAVATWAPIGVDVLLLVPLLVLSSRLTSNWRHAWASVWMFYLAIWVGQDYLSPQACAFLLMVILLGCLLTCFGGWPWPVATHRLTARMRRIVAALDPAPRLQGRMGLPRGDAAVLGIGCALFVVAMTTAHQLTPFALIPVVVVFLLSGRLRLKSLTLFAAVFPLVWLAVVAYPYTVGHVDALLGSFGALGQTTARAVTDRIAGSVDHLIVVNTRLAETALVVVLAAVGAVIARRRRVRWLTAALGAGAPLVLYVIQPYGGELLLRLYLYGLPFAAPLVVLPLMRKGSAPIRWPRGLGLLLLGSVLALTTIVSRYGNDALENFTPDEISVVDRLYEVAPPGSVLVEAVHNTPWRSQAYAGYVYQTLLSATAQPTSNRLNCGVVDSMGQAKGAYLIVTQSQVEEAQLLGIGPPGDVNQFVDKCSTSPGWSLVYKNAGGVIYHIQGVNDVSSPDQRTVPKNVE